ncbi:DUF2199 domain-containing protein [Roseateles amylovorans]|uniref:DUF2199 domain-containing protein n=1 Tax=Roseateles amylovorans TaxID=2978473 RepID=A0ABY6B239_9BURK|nr:DUF2199 domain-containing protein [Roseateles amylovorans]UXH79253.1 DUF2199 domain-containing protein [Roseateles amylovorans]
MTDASFSCSTCGQVHRGLPTDFGFRLPDEVHALDYLERYARCRSNADLCTVDESRYFIRGFLPLPLTEQDDDFCWGIWAEVDRATHDHYVAGFDGGPLLGTTARGTLANTIPGYEETSGLPVRIEFQDAGSRPKFLLTDDVTHALAHEQRGGISDKRHHDILEAVGHFKVDRED